MGVVAGAADAARDLHGGDGKKHEVDDHRRGRAPQPGRRESEEQHPAGEGGGELDRPVGAGLPGDGAGQQAGTWRLLIEARASNGVWEVFADYAIVRRYNHTDRVGVVSVM